MFKMNEKVIETQDLERIYEHKYFIIYKNKVNKKMYVEIENYIFFETVSESISFYKELKHIITKNFNIPDVDTKSKVHFKLCHDELIGNKPSYWIDIDIFEISSYEDLVEKINNIIYVLELKKEIQKRGYLHK